MTPNSMSVLLPRFASSQPAPPPCIRHWWLGCFTWLVVQAGAPLAAFGQHLEAVGAAVSLNVTQTQASPSVIDLGYYTLVTDADFSRYDEIGYRLAAYGRWQVGGSRFFVQPELGYTASRGQRYAITYYPSSTTALGPNEEGIVHRLRRGELAMLAGLHTGRHTYLLVGPVLAVNQRQQADPGYHLSELYNSLYQSVEPVNVLGQVGVGFVTGRFDFQLRYERSLTPYSRRFTFEGKVHSYRQEIRQCLLTAGFLLHKSPQPSAESPRDYRGTR